MLDCQLSTVGPAPQPKYDYRVTFSVHSRTRPNET